MVVLDKFSISNTFSKDVKGKGEYAEKDFLEYFFSNPKNDSKTLHDVREVAEYQKLDIDFVVDNEGGSVLPDIREVFSNKSRYMKIEVKYSGPALRTGKFAFEMVSHSRFGWGFNCKCDFMYVVFGEEYEKNKFKTIKRGLINFQKWIEFIRDKSNFTEVYYNNDENIIVNIMTRLSEMVQKYVLKYINK